MPKVTMTFSLPEEKYEHRCAVHGATWKNIVYEVDMFLRNHLKHGHEFKTADDALQAVRDHLWEECKAESLDPWED